MANGLQLNQSTVIGGLGTQTFTVASAGNYTCQFKINVPYQASGSSNSSSVTSSSSSLLVVVNKNGSPALTASLPAPTQPFVNGSVMLQCAAADVITVVLSSAAAPDNLANAIKGVVNLYQGF